MSRKEIWVKYFLIWGILKCLYKNRLQKVFIINFKLYILKENVIDGNMFKDEKKVIEEDS